MWPRRLFRLSQTYTHLISFVFWPCLEKQKGSVYSSKGWYRCEFWRGHGLATFALILCMEITHRCEAFDTSKIPSLREFCSLQAARSAGSWLPHCCLEHLKEAEILGSQIKAKGSIWIGRKERTVFSTVAGKLSSEWLDAVLLVPRAWILLHWKH